MQNIIMGYMSILRTFQDQLQKENGHPRQQRQLSYHDWKREVGHNKFTSALSQIKGYQYKTA